LKFSTLSLLYLLKLSSKYLYQYAIVTAQKFYHRQHLPYWHKASVFLLKTYYGIKKNDFSFSC